ncbi:MAG: patatin-like phospholipase family protein [Deltaproteobacteria bacterium]|nr:patatin-like phospholipase family protein [Deltaproteobacteria bacterium]
MASPTAGSLAQDAAHPIGLVLSGGGARGVFQVGVWKVLLDHPRGIGRAPLVISGTSAGALNGALIAAGLQPDDILEFWLDIAERPPVIANERFFKSLESALGRLLLREPLRGPSPRWREARILLSMLKKHAWYKPSGLLAMGLEFFMTARFDTLSHLLEGITTSYLFDTSEVRERLARAIGGDTLRSPRVRLAINTVDIRTGGVVRIVNHKPEKSPRASARHYRYEPELSLDMILASASIPLLFNPVQVGEHALWDGGLLVNSPMAPAVALGATRIVPVLVTTSGTAIPAGEVPRTFGGAVERLVDAFLENAYNIDRKLLLDRNALARETGDPHLREVDLFRAIRPQSGSLFDAGSYLYFEPRALMEMYQAGQDAARAWLARGPELDSREIEE